MLMLFDFQCKDCGYVDEQLVSSSVSTLECRKCGSFMSRKIGTPTISLDGTDPGFPDAYDKWARQHEKAGQR
jgi:putative FmdB family regulatory protein